MHLLLLFIGVFTCQCDCAENQNCFTDPSWIEFKLKFGKFNQNETEKLKGKRYFKST